MKPRVSRMLCVPLILALTLSTSSCWDRKELDQVGIIGSIGLDKGEGDSIVVSLEVISPRALASATTGTAGGGAPVVAVVLRDQAETVPRALSNAQRRTPRDLSTGQMSSVIFGQALAKEGIGDCLDSLMRDARIRNSAVLATCDTASDLLQRPLISTIPSRTLLDLSRNALGAGMTVRVTINEFALKLAEPGVEPVSMHIVSRRTKDVQVKRQGEETRQTDPAIILEQPVDVRQEVPGELPSVSPVLDPLKEAASGEFVPSMTVDAGIAAYKGDRLAGLLDGVEARGFLWLSGDLEQTVIEVPDPLGSGKLVCLDVVGARSSIRPVFTGGKGGIRIEADLHIDLEGGQFTFSTDLSQPGLVEALEKSLDAAIAREARSTLERVQKEFKTDIYGFGYEVYKANPALWATVETSWNDEAFPDLEVELQVQTRIRAPGSIYGLWARSLSK